jgi:hypothetical protein
MPNNNKGFGLPYVTSPRTNLSGEKEGNSDPGGRDACRFGGPEGRKNGSPRRELWVWCGGLDAAHGGDDAGRFLESGVGAGAMLTDHEPGRIPGGGTPPSTAGETPAATEARFVESHLFEIDLLTAHEPDRVGGAVP